MQSDACCLQSSFAVACAIVLLVVAWSDVEPQQEGHPSAQVAPTVHRMWRNTSQMPVPPARWREIGFAVKDYDHAEARQLVAAAGYGAVWDALPHFAAKADLFRLVVVANYGGWYADADMEPLPQLAAIAERHHLVFFNEACGFMWWNRFKYLVGASTITRAPQYRNNLFAAPRGWRPFRAAILMLESNTVHASGQWTVAEQIEATGPGLLTKTLALFPEELKQARIVSCAEQKKQLRHLGMHTWYS